MSEKKLKPSKVKDGPKEEKIPFTSWFYLQAKAGNVQAWQQRELEVFFKEKGLSNSETSDKYSEILKLY